MRIENVASKLVHNSKVSCFISVNVAFVQPQPMFQKRAVSCGQELIFSRLTEQLFTHHNFLT